MGLLSFIGGIHPPHSKRASENKPIRKALEPKTVTIPLRQHIGAPCDPCVKKGDAVKVGQVIGEASSFVCSPVHSSVSGVVKKIQEVDVLGGKETCVIIKSDGENTLHESVVPKGDVETLSAKEIIDIIRDAGIVGMGGAGFPTHIKLSPPPDKKIDAVILNGAECEPYLTADHRLMLEMPEKVVYGLKALMKAVSVDTGYIGIEDNKPDAIAVMKEAAKDEPGIHVVGLHTKYPQGAEKQLIYACMKREVPSGGLPMDAGVVVNNVGTAAAVADAIQLGMPLIERICTITGAGITEPDNLLIKNGTSLSEIIEQCGGYVGDPGKIILGGPMMGMSTPTDEIPSTKTTSGILVFPPEQSSIPKSVNCIQCGKCVNICPAFLQPVTLSAYVLKDRIEYTDKIGILDCIECGSCSFVCPSKRPLLHSIRVGKKSVLAARRKGN